MRRSTGLWTIVLLLLCVPAIPAYQATPQTDAQAVTTLVESLLNAPTDADRSVLLAAHKEVDLQQWTRALVPQLEGLWAQKRTAQTLFLLDFGRRQAESARKWHVANALHIEMARAQFAQQQYAAAEAIFRECLPAFEAEPNQEGIVRALFGIAESYSAREQTEQADPYYQRALKVAQQASLPHWYAFLSNWVGERCRLQGDLAQAQGYYEQCLPAARRANTPWLAGYALNNLGIVEMGLGDFARALTSLQQALALRQTLKEASAVSDTLDNLGTLYSWQGDAPLALDYYQQALQLRRHIGAQAKIAATLNNIALVQTHLYHWAEALRIYDESQTLSNAVEDRRGRALTALNVGYLYHVKGDTELGQGKAIEAEADFAQALEIYRKALNQFETWQDRRSILGIEMQMADIHNLQRNYVESLHLAQHAAALAEAQGDLAKLMICWSIQGKNYIALTQYDAAQQALERAMAASEQLRIQAAGGEVGQQQLFPQLASPFRCMAELRVLQGRPTEALTYVERMKARTLIDVLQCGRIPITRSMTPQEREHERQHNTAYMAANTTLIREQERPHPDVARVTAFRKHRDQTMRDYDAFRFMLYAAHPDLQARRGEARIITSKEIRGLLPDTKHAIVAFLCDHNLTVLFTVTRSTASASFVEVQARILHITSQELAKRVEAFRERVSDPNRAVSQEAGALYSLLLRPASQQLEGKTALTLVPDGSLWDLPFQALQTRKGHYLLQDASVSYAPSLTALREMNRLSRRRSGSVERYLLAFGNPALGAVTEQRLKTARLGGRLVSLPEAEREVRTLETIYGPQHSRVYTGTRALKSRALAEAGDYRILHFATHAILDNANPLYSYIVLSQSGNPGDDGLLTARDIMDLDLKADLAVLSACETARGGIRAGEGVVGLSWALFIAGCPTAVASQWEVDSASTTQLMLAFHRALHAGKPTATALREAELSLLNKPGNEHPFYWAGFVTIGAHNTQ